MPALVLGLPLHALLLHASVVVLPLAALLLVVAAFSDGVRRRAGIVLPLAGLLALVLVPLTTQSGEQLEARLPPDPAIEAHARAADALLPWTIGLAVLSVAVWFAARRARRGLPAAAPRDVTGAGGAGAARAAVLPARSVASVALAVLAVTAAVGTTVEVAHIGHLGARATWGFVQQLPAR